MKKIISLALSLFICSPLLHARHSSGSHRSYSHRTCSSRSYRVRSRSRTRVYSTRHGRIRRSAAAKDAFKREQPCPSTGRRSGACPGYVIDHVKPLACGGADDPLNMQWQTIAEGKAKDKWERKGCN